MVSCPEASGVSYGFPASLRLFPVPTFWAVGFTHGCLLTVMGSANIHTERVYLSNVQNCCVCVIVVVATDLHSPFADRASLEICMLPVK